MREYCVFCLTIYFIIWCFLQVHATERKNEKNQQTFVVRYKNGDQTIPVTVVVDSKKQTEYVINMSPRNPEKSVTLYDFKQRTIAYKDLTNRECFLGRLNGETLKHEIDALREIQNPIEGNPKVLSLDPHKSALTPTEIRNIAGQKTAVFCRKMSTWLIIPHRTHNILKRNIDEIEERTYRHHGFHTVQYSHYGHETTRRYRVPSNATSHSEHKMKDPLEEKHQQLEISNVTFEDDLHEHEYSPDQETRGKVLPHHSSLLPKTDFSHSDEINGAIEDPERTSSVADLNPNDHNFHSGNTDSHLITDLTLENNSQTTKTNERLISPSTHDSFIGKHNDGNNYHSNLHDFTLAQSENKISKFQRDNTLIKNEFSRRNDHEQYPVSVSHHPVENEFNARDLNLNTLPEKNIVSVDHIKNSELPSSSLEAQNLPSNFVTDQRHEFLKPQIQPAEDVHTIFEGFHNLRENNSFSETDYLYQVPFEVSRLSKNENNLYNHDKISRNPVLISDKQNINSADTHEVYTLFPDRYTGLLTTTDDYSTTNKPLNLENDLYESEVNRKLWQTNHVREGNKILADPTDSDINIRINASSISDGESSLPIREVGKNYNFHVANKEAGLHVQPSHQSPEIVNVNDKNKIQHSFPIPTTSIQEGLVPNQIRFQNILRHYKPDEIVIDLEKISTERPPNSISGHQTKPFSSSNASMRNLFPNLTRDDEIHGRQQILGVYPRGNIHNVSSSKRKINNANKHARNKGSFHSFRKPATRHSSGDRSVFSQPSLNSFHLPNEPQRQNLPDFFNQPPRLDALPPGVSLHPRHPQAPYANMALTNVLQPIPQQNDHRLIKSHRQRHHKRKDAGNKSCCGKSGLSSSCCSGHHGRRVNPKLRCCSPHKLHKSVKPFDPRQNFILHPRNKIIPPQTALRDTPLQRHSRNENISFQGRTMKDNSDRCQKEKMCRTLYESTQQVVVCRNINIEGC